MKSMKTNLTFEALFAHWDKGRTNFSGGDSGIQDFDLTTDFLIIFSRISFASPVHTSVVVSTATILSPLASLDPIQARKRDHTEAPSFSPVSEILLTLNKDFSSSSFFLLLYLLNNGHNIKLKWVTAAKGGGGGGGGTTTRKSICYRAKLTNLNFRNNQHFKY